MSFIKCAIYDTSTGAIKRYTGSSPEDVANQVGYCEEFYLNCPDAATHIINNEPVTIIPEIIPPTLEEVKAAKLQELAQARYNEEVGGIIVNGTEIDTDRESQSILNGAYVSMKFGLINPSVDWKGNDGWVPATLTEIEPIAQAVAQHVQSLFSREKVLATQVNAALSVEEVNSIVW